MTTEKIAIIVDIAFIALFTLWYIGAIHFAKAKGADKVMFTAMYAASVVTAAALIIMFAL